MTELLFKLLGGIGLFLMGMVLLTDGLKAFAGDSLRRALTRFTGTPGKAFLSGALVTVLVQSSSATTVTVIGFVSAGLLTFAQSVGVVLGASLGTTGTGWIIATLGLKISIGFYALPFVGVGALLRLLARGRLKSLGLALAGFGLIFIGIETLQEAMGALGDRFDLSSLPGRGPGAYLLAALIGALLTVLMQSSSAAVATTLTALHAGAISFEQAAALVVGAAIGTTVTGALAAIGGTTPAKRTAVAHVGFNLFAGLLALLLLPFFLTLIRWAQENLGLDPGALSLAAFHTLFILLGVGIVLPFLKPLSRKIEQWLPEREAVFTRHLDPSLYAAPEVALTAARRALRETASALFLTLLAKVEDQGSPPPNGTARPEELSSALIRLQGFLRELPAPPDGDANASLRIDAFHALEHLQRLSSRVVLPESIRKSREAPDLSALFKLTATHLRECSAALLDPANATPSRIAGRAAELAEFRKQDRPRVMEWTAGGRLSPEASIHRLDAVRWMDRIGYHSWRICEHLLSDQPN